MSTARKARNWAFGCSSASGRRASPRPISRPKRCGSWSTRVLAMAREAPEDPLCRARPCGTARTRRSPRHPARRPRAGRTGEPPPPRAGGGARCARRSWSDQFQRRLGRLIGRNDGAGDLDRLQRAPIARPGTAVSAGVIAGEGATMQRDSAWHGARHLEDLDAAEEIGRLRRGACGRAAKPGEAQARPLPDPVRPARRRIAAHPFRRVDHRRQPVARKSSFLQDKLGEQRICRRCDASSTIRFASAASARGRSTARACGLRVRIWSPAASSGPGSAESASARQLGIEPTGHAVRGASGAPGAGPSNMFMEAGSRSREELARRLSRGHAGHRADRPGHQLRHRRLQPRARSGFMVRGGEIAEPVAEITIAVQPPRHVRDARAGQRPRVPPRHRRADLADSGNDGRRRPSRRFRSPGRRAA